MADSLHMSPSTQSELILSYLREGRSLTTLQAAHVLGICSFTKRISELRRAGIPIMSTWLALPSGRRCLQYSLEPERPKINWIVPSATIPKPVVL